MPVKHYFDSLQPENRQAEIWRFMPLWKFQDFLASEELFFNRADRFPQDEEEGIPPEDYIRRLKGLEWGNPAHEKELNHDLGYLSQQRECYYISCWHLYRQETGAMWNGFADEGIAVQSRYDLLYDTLNDLKHDDCDIGLVRYGEEHLLRGMRYNVLQFINTKRWRFRSEGEVRAMIECHHPFPLHNRHFREDNWPERRPRDEYPQRSWIPNFKRRKVDLKKLITGVRVSPLAAQEVFDDVKIWLSNQKYSFAPEWSALKQHQSFIPTTEELKRIGMA